MADDYCKYFPITNFDELGFFLAIGPDPKQQESYDTCTNKDIDSLARLRDIRQRRSRFGGTQDSMNS